MGLFDFLKSKPKPEIKTAQKITTTDNIKQLIDLTVCEEDAMKLKAFLGDKIKNSSEEEPLPDESMEFNSQEIVDFMAEKPVCFYGFFDWKEYSSEFDIYVRNAMKRNFGLEITKEKICDLYELTTIDKVYKLYEAELEKQQITLCNIDIGSDSYQIILVKNEYYEKLFAPVKKLGFKIEHFSEEW